MSVGETWAAVLLACGFVVIVLLELVAIGALNRQRRILTAYAHRLAMILAAVQDLGGGLDMGRPVEAPELELDDVGPAAPPNPAP